MLRASLICVSLCVVVAAAAGVTAQPPATAGDAEQPARSHRTALRVVVSIPPLRGLIEPWLPEGSEVQTLIPPGASEHGYEIPPTKLAALARADLVVYVGLGLEPQVESFLREHPREGRRVVEFAEIPGAKKAIEEGEGPRESHHDDDGAEGHDHDGNTTDPHLWLDPMLVKSLVEQTLYSADQIVLERAHQESSTQTMHDKAAALLGRLGRLDASYHTALDGLPRRTIIVGHGAYGWLAKRYRLEVVAISGLNAAEPTPAAVAEAAKAAKEKGVRAIFVEPQLSQAAARRIAEATGVKVLTLDPLGDGDWFAMMEKNLAALKEALGEAPASAAPGTSPARPSPDTPGAAGPPAPAPEKK